LTSQFFSPNLSKYFLGIGDGQAKTPTNFREIRNQNILGNKYIKFNNKSLIFKTGLIATCCM
jgi:hypothetical protein